MGPVNITDYAQPLIRMEKLLRDIHDKCLQNDYVAANDLNILLLTESRVLCATLAIMDAEQKRKFK